jgi:hypothetical protein
MSPMLPCPFCVAPARLTHVKEQGLIVRIRAECTGEGCWAGIEDWIADEQSASRVVESWNRRTPGENVMAKQKAKAQLTGAHQAFVLSVPAEHHAEVESALTAAPQEHRGPIIDIINGLKDRLQKLGAIPWGQLLALIPLIAAAFASPLTGLGPLVLAIAALFAPAA